ncbi:MAG: class A beta-lactamase-related serine hydrolase, partial [Pedobacter sp.]
MIQVKTITLLRSLLVLGSFLSLTGVPAQTAQDTAAMVEQIFARYQPQNPGAQVTVSRNGKVIFSKAWGMADLEHDTRLSISSISEAGSVSKEFTAAAILLIEQQGKLSLNDDIRKYLPEIPDYGSIIRIRHLMHHTSGIKDWGYVADIGGWPRGTKTYRNEDALEIIARQKTLNNKPGDEYIYSNSGFNLLAMIVQKVSGMSLAAFSQQYIFVPAGMKHSQWRDNFKTIVPGRAMAYEKVATGYQTDMPNEYVYGQGGLLTTSEDLCKWVDYFTAAKIGGPALLKKQLALDTFNSGNLHYYAAGLRIQKRKGYNVIRHDGATASYRASLEYFP